MDSMEEAMKANVGSAANGNVDLNLDVTDPKKSVASRPQQVGAATATATTNKSS